MTKILLVSAGWKHPPVGGRSVLRKLLSGLPDYRVDTVHSLAEAVGKPLSGYDALVLYYHHKDAALSDGELAAFSDYVSRGGGVLAVHSATASYKQTPGYFKVLGGRFTGHGPVESFEIRPAEEADRRFDGIGPFRVTDELYLHELQPDIRVHFTAEYENRRVPIVWTRTHGRGRVCYVCPGHRTATMRQPETGRIIRAGLSLVTDKGGTP